MQHKYVVCDPELCTGCHLCEFICAATKVGAYALDLSRIRTAQPEPTLMMSVSCRLCEEAPCVSACPRDALSISPDNGVIMVDKVRCTGCGWCIEACDFGAIALDPSTKSVVMCDLCAELDQPKCVEYCPKQALSLSTVEEVAQRARDRAVRQQLAADPAS